MNVTFFCIFLSLFVPNGSLNSCKNVPTVNIFTCLVNRKGKIQDYFNRRPIHAKPKIFIFNFKFWYNH